jgi:hypothetical protein
VVYRKFRLNKVCVIWQFALPSSQIYQRAYFVAGEELNLEDRMFHSHILPQTGSQSLHTTANFISNLAHRQGEIPTSQPGPWQPNRPGSSRLDLPGHLSTPTGYCQSFGFIFFMLMSSVLVTVCFTLSLSVWPRCTLTNKTFQAHGPKVWNRVVS